MKQKNHIDICVYSIVVILFNALSSRVGASQISVSMIVVIVVAYINVACGVSQCQGAETRSSFQIRHSRHATGNVLGVFAMLITFFGVVIDLGPRALNYKRKQLRFNAPPCRNYMEYSHY